MSCVARRGLLVATLGLLGPAVWPLGSSSGPRPPKASGAHKAIPNVPRPRSESSAHAHVH